MRPASMWPKVGTLGIPGLVALLVVMAGCTTEQPVDMEAVRKAEPFYVSTNPNTVRAEEEYQAADRRTLGYISHRGAGHDAIVYLHGIESHAGWFDEAADLLCARGFDVFCLDRRGSGVNRENRGFPSGDLDAADTLFSDIHTFVQGIRPRYDHVFLVGLSWGGKLALAHALTHPEDCDALVLITPGIRSRVGAGFFTKIKALWCSVFQPRALIAIPIKPEMFTRTPRFLKWIEDDPLRLHYASTRFFLISNDLDGYIDDRIANLRLPVLLVLAGQDVIIDNQAVVGVLAGSGRQGLRVLTYEDQTHSIQFDAPQRLAQDMDTWLREVAPSAVRR